MNSTLAGWLQFLLLFAALAACYIPLGNYIARIFTDTKHWRVERGIYKLTGVDPDADMRWTVYVRSILAFSLVAVLNGSAFLYSANDQLLVVGEHDGKLAQLGSLDAAFFGGWQHEDRIFVEIDVDTFELTGVRAAYKEWMAVIGSGLT